MKTKSHFWNLDSRYPTLMIAPKSDSIPVESTESDTTTKEMRATKKTKLMRSAGNNSRKISRSRILLMIKYLA